MTKQKHEKSQPEKKNGHKPETAPFMPQVSAAAGIAEFAGTTGNGSFESQASQLGNLPRIQREAMAKQIGQAQGNHQLQRMLSTLKRNDVSQVLNTAQSWESAFDTELTIPSSTVQRHQEDEADLDVQRQPATGQTGATPTPTQPAVVQDLTKDDAFVNQTIDGFQDGELKKQIGTNINNRRDFLRGMQQYLGSLDD